MSRPELCKSSSDYSWLFLFIDPAPTLIYTLSLHDALPISGHVEEIADQGVAAGVAHGRAFLAGHDDVLGPENGRSEEHTSELQSLTNLVCRLLLEKKKGAALRAYQTRLV